MPSVRIRETGELRILLSEVSHTAKDSGADTYRRQGPFSNIFACRISLLNVKTVDTPAQFDHQRPFTAWIAVRPVSPLPRFRSSELKKDRRPVTLPEVA